MASIEDQLTEPQRESLRAERRKSAHSDTSADHQNSNSKPTDDRSAKQTNEKSSNPEKSKSAVVVEEIDEYVLGNGIVLTVEQEAIADKISSSHFRHLRKLHRQIRVIHDRLVALESDKLVEIEKVLTKEQITQLRSERRSSSDHHVTSTDK